MFRNIMCDSEHLSKFLSVIFEVISFILTVTYVLLEKGGVKPLKLVEVLFYFPNRYLRQFPIVSTPTAFHFYYNSFTNMQENIKEGVVIDLRSDTVTKPSPLMRQAIYEAEVGDDVYKEDPTVNELERKIALMLNKEAALFVPTGTMSNLIAVMAHCYTRGMEVLLGDMTHMFLYEQGGIAQIAGVHSRTLSNKPDGTFSLDELLSKIRDRDMHEPKTGLICIENTHNKCGGKALKLEFLEKLGKIKEELNLPLHMDGARLFNASVFLKIPASVLVKHCDSINICLSKGLGAPVGSLLIGTTDFIQKAIRIRKVLGGGMRQAGILAAAGIFALDKMIDRLEIDHLHTKKLAEAIHNMNSKLFHVDLQNVQTNILMFEVNNKHMNVAQFCQKMGTVSKEEAQEFVQPVIVKMIPFGPTTVRAIFHCDISEDAVPLIIKKFQFIAKSYE